MLQIAALETMTTIYQTYAGATPSQGIMMLHAGLRSLPGVEPRGVTPVDGSSDPARDAGRDGDAALA